MPDNESMLDNSSYAQHKENEIQFRLTFIWARSAVCSESDCRSRGGEFEAGQVPYFRGD